MRKFFLLALFAMVVAGLVGAKPGHAKAKKDPPTEQVWLNAANSGIYLGVNLSDGKSYYTVYAQFAASGYSGDKYEVENVEVYDENKSDWVAMDTGGTDFQFTVGLGKTGTPYYHSYTYTFLESSSWGQEITNNGYGAYVRSGYQLDSSTWAGGLYRWGSAGWGTFASTEPSWRVDSTYILPDPAPTPQANAIQRQPRRQAALAIFDPKKLSIRSR